MTKFRILFVDDEESVLRPLSSFFKKLGHEAFTATSGKEGISVFERVHPHVTVLDLKMPGMSGLEVLEVLRRSNAVVLMLTGHGEIETAVEAMQLGAENFLQKPVDMSHLRASVEKAAEKAELRDENRELRKRLTPTLKRQVMKLVILVALVAGAMAVGAVIGGDPERPTVPIPVPIDTSGG